jgi:hypothetical protein
MFDLSKEESAFYGLTNQQYDNALREAAILRAIRLGTILVAHGVDATARGHFTNVGPNTVAWVEEVDAPPVAEGEALATPEE